MDTGRRLAIDPAACVAASSEVPVFLFEQSDRSFRDDFKPLGLVSFHAFSSVASRQFFPRISVQDAVYRLHFPLQLAAACPGEDAKPRPGVALNVVLRAKPWGSGGPGRFVIVYEVLVKAYFLMSLVFC